LPSSDESGSQEPASPASHFFLADDAGSKRWQRLSEADRRHFGSRQMRTYQLAAVVTPDYRPGTHGAFASAPYRSFMRDIFPDVTYVHLGLPCHWITDFGSKYTAIQVWLKRKGAPDLLDVPSELLSKAKAAMSTR
jgi:hypothetical protein